MSCVGQLPNKRKYDDDDDDDDDDICLVLGMLVIWMPLIISLNV